MMQVVQRAIPLGTSLGMQPSVSVEQLPDVTSAHVMPFSGRATQLGRVAVAGFTCATDNPLST